MFVTTYSDARNNFASVLDRAKKEGNVVVVRADGTEFNISVREKSSSPFAGVKQIVHLASKDFLEAKSDFKKSEKSRF